MGLGREVADAYIEVHGDLSDFRKDLEKARPMMQEWAKENADSFVDGFGDRMKARWNKQWNSIIDVMESGTKVDFNRMIENFDLNDLDAASEKIHDMLHGMQAAGKLSAQQMRDVTKTIDEQIKALQRQHFLEQQMADDREMWDQAHKVMMAQLADAQQRHSDLVDEAIRDNKAWARTFEGIAKNSAIERLNEDFEKLAKITREADWDKFAKGFRDYDEMAERVEAVTAAMRENNRISEQNANDLNARTREYIANMRERLRLMEEEKRLDAEAKGEALTRARLLREEMERYNASLEGMVRAAHFKKLEDDFRSLTTAIATSDWTKLAKGKTDMDQFRDSVMDTAWQMRNAGRITNEEFGRIATEVQNANVQLETTRTRVNNARDASINWSRIFAGIAGHARSINDRMSGTLSHFRGLAGLNIFGDMLQKGIEIATNIDRVAQSISQASLKIGSAASLLGTAGAGLVTIGSDLAAVGNIGILAPGFIAAAGIQIGVLVAAFKDMKTVLKDLGPQFTALQDNISKRFWEEAEAPIRNLVDSLMPTLSVQLETTATAMGGLFAAFTDGFTKNATPKRVEGMFKKMNAAIDIAKAGMEPLASAFVTLGEHASDYFGRFAEWTVDLSKGFDDFITKAAKDGRLKKWTEEAIDAFKDTGRAIGGVVEIFQGINTAAEKAGIGGLKEFADSLERAADIAKSPQFQQGLSLWLSGAKDATDSILEAIDGRLFPALGNIAPVMETALQLIGESMGTLIGYLADIIENPRVQAGILAMTTGIKTAVDTLEPAIGPMGDSLGSLLEITGTIIKNVAEIVTAFAVTLGPTIDSIGRKFESMADPLTTTVKTAIEELGPVFKSLDEKFIGPVVNAINTKLLPAVDSFVREAGPFLKQAAEAVAPVFETLIGTTLPAVLSWAEKLFKPVGALFALLTPALRDVVAGIGNSFNHFAGALESFNKWADPAYKVMYKINEEMKKLNDFKINPTSNPISDLIVKYTISAIAADPVIASFATFFGKLSKGWTENLSSFILMVSDPKTYAVSMAATMANNLPNWMFNGFKIEEFATAVGTWLYTNIQVPLQNAWRAFLVRLALIFMGGGGEEEGGEGGGGTPMGGRAVGAKVMPQMLDPESEKTFLDTFIAGITEKTGGWGALISASLATWQAGTKLTWDNFWNGLPFSTEGGMGQSSAKVATSTVAMGINIGAFVAQNAPKWAGFFSTAQQQANTHFGSAAVTVAGKTLAMAGSIGTFTTNAKTTWTTTLAGMAATATQQWNAMNTTTSGRLGAIAATTALKMGAVKTSTDTSLARVAALFVQHFTTAKTEVEGSLGTIVGKFSGLKGRIESALSGLKGSLESIGGDAMDGMKAGIDSRAGLIATAAAAVVAGAIAAAREAQKSSSPSKIYRGLGGDAGDGYALGFEDSESPVAKAAAAMVETAVSAVSHSKMYVAGAQAALGFADGLESKAGTISASIGTLMPILEASGAITVNGSGGVGVPTPGVGTPTPAGNVTYVTNDVKVSTQAQSPEVIGSIVGDTMDDLFSTFSNA